MSKLKYEAKPSNLELF